MKTMDKILLGVLVIFLIGMSGVLITALPGGSEIERVAPKDKVLTVTDITPREIVSEVEKDEPEEVDVAITGSALDRASAVALDYIGEGIVTDSEVGDEEGYYEIEITFSDGNEVDVHLDENFKVLSTEYEGYGDDD